MIIMSKKNHEGYCRICNEFGKLTYEHIPPKSALNDKEARIYTGDSYIQLMCDKNRYPWETDGVKYKLLQKGLGDYTLCEKCNNITGKLYGEEYKKWFNAAIKSIVDNSEEHKNAERVVFKLRNVHPGRFIRQILSIICSTYPGFTKMYPYVKELILNKDYVFSDIPDFKIFMYLLKNPYNGWFNCAMSIDGNIKHINEINLYPFGFCISLSNTNEDEADITKFINCSYNNVYEIDITMNVHEKNNVVPMDFRTKQEIVKESEKIRNGD